MRFKDLIWLWRISAPVCQGTALRSLKRRLVFMVRSAAVSEALMPFLEPPPGSPLQRLVAERPEMVGAVVWPYQCLGWDAKSRLGMIAAHYDALRSLPTVLDFSVAESRNLLDLSAYAPGLRVVLDRPKWFMREGQLVLNLFLGDRRVYSLAFSVAHHAGQLMAYVGAIQGGNTDGIVDEYRDLTKTLHGMRPRDFLIEVFRAFCRSIRVGEILAVADARRHHRSDYFEGHKVNEGSVNYDEVWAERGGVLSNEDFFQLSPQPDFKAIEDIPSKKRAMYRRRYEMLAMIDECLRQRLDAGNTDDAVHVPGAPGTPGRSEETGQSAA